MNEIKHLSVHTQKELEYTINAHILEAQKTAIFYGITWETENIPEERYKLDIPGHIFFHNGDIVCHIKGYIHNYLNTKYCGYISLIDQNQGSSGRHHEFIVDRSETGYHLDAERQSRKLFSDIVEEIFIKSGAKKID